MSASLPAINLRKSQEERGNWVTEFDGSGPEPSCLRQASASASFDTQKVQTSCIVAAAQEPLVRFGAAGGIWVEGSGVEAGELSLNRPGSPGGC